MHSCVLTFSSRQLVCVGICRWGMGLAKPQPLDPVDRHILVALFIRFRLTLSLLEQQGAGGKSAGGLGQRSK